jgi:hypothetical protein
MRDDYMGMDIDAANFTQSQRPIHWNNSCFAFFIISNYQR